MIESICQCGAPVSTPESSIGTKVACTACGKPLYIVSGEALPDGAGAGDFDAKLIITKGPLRIGEQLVLGGVQEITLGKLPDRNIVLEGGTRVSRAHCKLVRLDFGPSRWELHDNSSKNGVLINGHRVLNQELKNGDTIHVGEYELKFISALEQVVAAAKERERKSHKGPVCPSCGALLPGTAKICVNCGVDVKTGRSLVVSKGLDEDALAVNADTWIRTLSWIIPFGLFPIASEAFGTKKPLTTWVIFSVTVAASIAFLIGIMSSGNEPGAGLMNLMMWNGEPQARVVIHIPRRSPSSAPAVRSAPPKPVSDEEDLTDVDLDADGNIVIQRRGPHIEGTFHWYQLFTSATLHQPVLITPFLGHLGGNMLFLLVFGLRVNELIGNAKMSVIYPLMAVLSGLSHHLAMAQAPLHPYLGASGAVMGLAGMYFIFFPVQRVHMAIWFRAGILTRWQCFYKIFTMRGFWLLVLWMGLQDVLPLFLGSSDGVAHWAHAGGFVSGMLIALILLFSRQVSAMGNDLVSVILGKRAWALVGKPSAHLAAMQ